MEPVHATAAVAVEGELKALSSATVADWKDQAKGWNFDDCRHFSGEFYDEVTKALLLHRS